MAWIAAHRWPLVAALLVIAGALALGIATFRPDWLPSRTARIPDQIAKRIGQQADEAGKTVASLFDLRSPGERLAGVLASLKGRPLLHERALPKVRRPLSPLAAIVAAPPPVPPVVVPPAETPLINIVKPPVPVAPVALTTVPGGLPGGFPGISPLPGGGGVVTPPQITPPPDVPIVPVIPITPTPGVPEPATWLMMLLGFVMIGFMSRRATQATIA